MAIMVGTGYMAGSGEGVNPTGNCSIEQALTLCDRVKGDCQKIEAYGGEANANVDKKALRDDGNFTIGSALGGYLTLNAEGKSVISKTQSQIFTRKYTASGLNTLQAAVGRYLEISGLPEDGKPITLPSGMDDGAIAGHGFNQLIATKDGLLITADQRDNTPKRSMHVSKRNLADISRNNTRAALLPFAGASGTKITYLTNYPKGQASAGNPYLVDLGNDRFLLLWNETPVSDSRIGYYYNSTSANEAPVLCYTYLNGGGEQLAPVVKTRAYLSDCQPIVTQNGNVTWYTREGGNMRFHTMQVGDLSGLKPVTSGSGTGTVLKNDLADGWHTIGCMGSFAYLNSANKLELNKTRANAPIAAPTAPVPPTEGGTRACPPPIRAIKSG